MDRRAKKELLRAVTKAIKGEVTSVRRANDQALAAASDAKPSTSADAADGYGNDHIHARVHLDQLKALTKLETEINGSDSKSPSRVTEPCYVELVEGKQKTGFYFVTNQATIDTVQLITRRSPIGQAIANREVGTTVPVKIESETRRYKITKIA